MIFFSWISRDFTQVRIQENVVIKAPQFQRAVFEIVGTSPYVQLRFTAKARNMMKDKMLAGQKAKKGKARDARDFEP